MEKIRSTYQGSKENYRRVVAQIAQRWGESEVANYDPYSNCLTFRTWMKAGFRVKRGEKALKSMTLIEKKDDEGNIVIRYPRIINLFYEKQVEKINS